MCNGKWKGGSIDDQKAFVDVRDVATAHVLALTNGKPGERYLVSHGCGTGVDYLTIGKLIAQSHEEYKDQVPKSIYGKFLMYLIGPFAGISWFQNYNNIGLPFNYTTEKVENELGFPKTGWTPLETTMRDMVDSLKAHGILS